MGSSASQGGPQQMPQNPGASPVMDYNNAGPGQMVQYGNMPQVGNTGPVMDYNNAGPSQNVQYGGAIPGTQGPYMGSGMPMPTPGMLKPGMGWSATDGGGLLGGGFTPPNMRPGLLKPGDMGGNRTFEFRDSDGNGVEDRDQPGYRPPVQNPGMPNNKAPGTRIDGGAKGKVYNPKPKPKPKGAFKGLSKGTMPSMKKHVQAGKMGQARKAFEAGGGKWTKDVHKRLKKKYG